MVGPSITIVSIPIAQRVPLREAAEATLAQRGMILRFPPLLAARYEMDRAQSRARELCYLAIISALFYGVIGPLFQFFVIPKPNWPSLVIQFAILMTASALAIIKFFQPDARAVARETAAGLWALVPILLILYTIHTGPSELTNALAYCVFPLPMIFNLLFFRLSYKAMVFYIVVATSSLAFALLESRGLSELERIFPLDVLVCSLGPALVTAVQLDQKSRCIYLHSLLQRLRIDQLASDNGALSHLSTTDALTGAANRRCLDKVLTEFCAHKPENGCLLLIDVDNFKTFNDHYGHQAGDIALREVVSALQAQLRANDLLARFGGEEFAVVLPESSLAEAMAIAQRFCDGVAAHRFVIGGSLIGVTISVGGVVRTMEHAPSDLISLADKALYEAKYAGRNNVRWYSQSLTTSSRSS